MGSGAFAVPILERLLADPRVEVVGVVSAPDRPAGRGGSVRAAPVAEVARSRELTLLQPDRLRAAEPIAALLALRPDLGILADYGQIVPAALLEAIPHGVLNLHPSILPRHRGATPIPAAILAGDRQTGVSLIQMDPGIDSGPIVGVAKVGLDGTEAAPDLEIRLAEIAAGLLARSIGAWLAGTLLVHPQPGDGVTLTRPLRRADGRLDPNRPAVELERQVRAYRGWPGSFFESEAGRVVVLAGSVASELHAQPGTLVLAGSGLALATTAGALRLDRVLPAGGRAMTGAELLRGRPGLAGTSVGTPVGR
ncbi:MAG TPA: methionyl-tRNA formyltransferase [Candidatus Limnocylindrales bacterium]